MSWSYLDDAKGARGHADRMFVPEDEAELRHKRLTDCYSGRDFRLAAVGGCGIEDILD